MAAFCLGGSTGGGGARSPALIGGVPLCTSICRLGGSFEGESCGIVRSTTVTSVGGALCSCICRREGSRGGDCCPAFGGVGALCTAAVCRGGSGGGARPVTAAAAIGEEALCTSTFCLGGSTGGTWSVPMLVELSPHCRRIERVSCGSVVGTGKRDGGCFLLCCCQRGGGYFLLCCVSTRR